MSSIYILCYIMNFKTVIELFQSTKHTTRWDILRFWYEKKQPGNQRSSAPGRDGKKALHFIQVYILCVYTSAWCRNVTFFNEDSSLKCTLPYQKAKRTQRNDNFIFQLDISMQLWFIWMLFFFYSARIRIKTTIYIKILRLKLSVGQSMAIN